MVAAVVLLALIAAAFVPWPVPTALAQRWFGDRIQRTVAIGGDQAWFRLAPRPTVHLGTIAVGAPDWSDAATFLRAESLAVTVTFGTLLGAHPHILSLEVGYGEVLLERSADGRRSWAIARSDAADAPERAPRIDRLEARRIDWRFVDVARRTDLRGTLSLVDSEAAAGGEEPRMALRGSGRLADLPSDVSANGGSMIAAADAGPQPLSVVARVGEGRLRFDGEADALASLDGLRGQCRVTGTALGALGALFGAVLPATPPFSFDGSLRRDASRWSLAINKGRIGESDLQRDLVFEPGQSDRPGRLNGSLRSARMRIVDLGRSVGFGAQERRGGRVLPDVALDLPSLRDMNATLDLKVAALELPAVAPIRNVAARLQLSEGVLALGELQAQAAGGTIDGAIRIDACEQPGSLHTELRIRRLALQRWLPKLDCAFADIAIRGGIARLQPLVVDIRDSMITAEGPIDLSKEMLALRVRAAPRDASPLSLRAPIDVKGSFADPRVSVDRTGVAGRLIASVALGALLTPLAALLPLLDFGEGEVPSPCQDRFAAPSTGKPARKAP